MNHYETVFILNPVLSETQIEEAVKKYESLLKSQKCKVVHKEVADVFDLDYLDPSSLIIN